MYEDDIFPPDQEGIFKGDLACLQGINLTTSTTEDDVFMGGTWLLVITYYPYGGVLDIWSTLGTPYCTLMSHFKLKLVKLLTKFSSCK